jgi:predicted PurR-regulated permease PerM
MLIFSYLVLSLIGFDGYARRVHRILPSNEGRRWLEIARQVSQDFQRYIVVRTLIGLISGMAVGIVTWLMGLEFAFIWGLLSFLLSYIPIFGSILALVLPLLFALAQFDQWHIELLMVFVLLGIRVILSTFVDPMLQGKFLKPTPLTVLLSVTFWGWLWGVAGAFIGVPLTILLVIICYQFQHTQWVAILLADMEQMQ